MWHTTADCYLKLCFLGLTAFASCCERSIRRCGWNCFKSETEFCFRLRICAFTLAASSFRVVVLCLVTGRTGSRLEAGRGTFLYRARAQVLWVFICLLFASKARTVLGRTACALFCRGSLAVDADVYTFLILTSAAPTRLTTGFASGLVPLPSAMILVRRTASIFLPLGTVKSCAV